MVTDNIVLAVFSGTGCTRAAAEQLARRFAAAGKRVRFVDMDKPESLAEVGFDTDATLGLAVPVACFTTYPTVWRFIDALPDGGGRGVFLLVTMGGMGAGMQGPVGRALERKGYRLLAASGIRLARLAARVEPGRDLSADERREAVLAGMEPNTGAFADRLLSGRGGWSRGWLNPVSALFHWFGRKGISFRGFRRFYPVTVAAERCTGCGACAAQCPERAITLREGKAVISGDCQSCQRCVGVCPARAIGLPGKPGIPYNAL